MRILLATSIAETIDAFFVEWVEAWLESGAQVVTLSGGCPRNGHDHHTIEHLTQAPGPRTLGAAFSLHAAVRQVAPDVIVTNTATVSAALRARRHEMPLVYFCHGLHWPNLGLRSWPMRAVEGALLRNTDAAIAINRDDESWFARRLPAERLLYLRGGVGLDLARWKQREPHPPARRDPRALWVGALEKRKQPHLALDVLEEARRVGQPWHLDVLGDGSLEASLRTAVERRGLSGAVTFHGFADPLPFLQEATALLHTATWEGLPRVVLEAAAVGTPIVALDVKGTRDVPGVSLGADARGLADLLCGVGAAAAKSSPLDDRYDARTCALDALRFLEAQAEMGRRST